MQKDNKRYIDLSDIKEADLGKTTSFTDLMSRSEKKKAKENNIDDIEEMIDEEKLQTKDLSDNLQNLNKSNNDTDDNLSKTQILELTRQMKYNFEENTKENIQKKKSGISPLNIIGEINLFCIGYYIYILIFTDLSNKVNYLSNGIMIVLLVFLFGISTISSKKINKLFTILNIICIMAFLSFNIYSLI